jgi:hypothetical protein
MKKFEYNEHYSDEQPDKLHELEQAMQEDYDLPEFSKEVPSSSKRNDGADATTIEYSWRKPQGQALKVRKIEFSKKEMLDDFYKTNVRDGADTICFGHNGATYILRKTTGEVAQALYRAAGKISGLVERVVGYLTSLLRNDYVISRVDGTAWSFDRRITRKYVNHVELDTLQNGNKTKLFDMIIESIASLHSRNMIIGRFNLSNILLLEDRMQLTDLRKLRASRRRSYVVDEFTNIMQYLFAVGVARKEDIYAGVAAYATLNEEGCNEWYKTRTGKEPEEDLDVATLIEQEIVN